MYKLINVIQDANGIQIRKDRFYSFLHSQKKLCEFDLRGNLLWNTCELSIYYNYFVTDDMIIYGFLDEQGIIDTHKGTIFIDRILKSIIKHENIELSLLNGNKYIYNNYFYSFISKNNVDIYDFKNLSLVSSCNIQHMTGYIISITEQFIITKDNMHIYVYLRNISFSLLYKKDLSEYIKYFITAGEIDIRIRNAYIYKDSVIVTSAGGILRMVIETGEILWTTKSYARTIEIVKNIGYACSGLSIYMVNLENGEIIHYGWQDNRLPNVNYDGKEYLASGHEVIYHEGFLWYSVYFSGKSFLIAINPKNGNYEWVHRVETNEKTYSPIFYKDKMYILATGNELHIYEKTK
jgi:hypothetical protein